MENEKWYAVQETSEDAWDYGSSDFEEAKAMLKKQGHGLIAVINNDFCEDEIQFDDLFDLDDFEDAELAEIVRNAGAWDEPNVEESMNELCNRAGRELRKRIADGEDCSEAFELMRLCASEEWFADTPDVSEDEEDMIDWLRYGAEQGDPAHVCQVIQHVLNVDMGI